MNTKYIKTIFHSFYSVAPYKEALSNWRGFGLKYLLIVTALSSSLITLGWMWDLNKINPTSVADSITGFILSEPDLSFEENINRFLNLLTQIPEIKIENGKTIISSAEPYSIIDPVSGYDVAIIDTTGKYKSLEGTDAVLLLTDTKLIAKNERGHESIAYLNDLKKHYNIDEDSLNEILYIIAQIPPFGLRHGKFITEDNKLYKILDKKNQELAAIGPDAVLMEEMEPMVAISPSEINYKSIFNKKGGTIKAEDLNEDMLFELIESGIVTIKKVMLWGAPIIALPLVIFTSFIFNCIMLIFYAFIGHLFIKIMKLGQFEYKEVMRIAAIAITPTLLVSVLLPQIIPSQGTVYFLISIGYLYYAITSVTKR